MADEKFASFVTDSAVCSLTCRCSASPTVVVVAYLRGTRNDGKSLSERTSALLLIHSPPPTHQHTCCLWSRWKKCETVAPDILRPIHPWQRNWPSLLRALRHFYCKTIRMDLQKGWRKVRFCYWWHLRLSSGSLTVLSASLCFFSSRFNLPRTIFCLHAVTWRTSEAMRCFISCLKWSFLPWKFLLPVSLPACMRTHLRSYMTDDKATFHVTGKLPSLRNIRQRHENGAPLWG